VPRAVGQRLEDGRETLVQAGFEVLALTIGDGEIRNESTIGSQSPAGGASVPRGSLVVLYVTG
jgi:beta-lactam-binding protein with PASTA domain